MKNKFFTFFILYLTFSLPAVSQQNNSLLTTYKSKEVPLEQPSIILKTNPGTMLIGPIAYTSEYRIAFEIPTYLYYGIQIGVSYLGENLFLGLMEKDTTTVYGLPAKPYDLVVRGFRLQFTYKRYVFQKTFGYAPYGIYIALHYSFSKAYITFRPLNMYKEYIFAVHENYDLIAGYQFKISRFVFDLFSGVGYKNNFWGVKSGGQVQEIEGLYLKIPVKLVLGFNLGYEF